MGKEILKMSNISKIYPNGVKANEDVNFSVFEGEIHALMGENGAGKSTLMKILFGIESHQKGDIYLNNKKVLINSPTEAINLGIGMVHQHFMLVPSLTVAENMVLGIEPVRGGLIDTELAIKMTNDISKKYNLFVDPFAKVKDLPVGQKQKVEILKALLRGAKILILDEPTAVLTPQETQELFAELLELKEKGHTIIFISHKLSEIKEITDRITIMRNGIVKDVVVTDTVSKQEISRLMVGRDVLLEVSKDSPIIKEVCLDISNLSHTKEDKALLKEISFTVRNGEIVGVAGVEGNGQTELVDLITGMKKIDSGEIKVNGERINDLSIRQIRELGLAHIHEDRLKFGVASNGTIEENLVSDRYYRDKFSNKILLNSRYIKEEANELIKTYKAKCKSRRQKVKGLSGGNIQKVIVAREFSLQPKLVVANQPSRGIDVGSTEFIYKKLVELRDNGSGILLVSADLNEVLELSDRLIVMYNGEIAVIYDDMKDIKISELGEYMLGLRTCDDKIVRSGESV